MHRYIIHMGSGTILSLSECVMLETSMDYEDIERDLHEMRDRFERINDECVCSHCDMAWTDPESNEYLDNHFECESCSEDWPIEELRISRSRDKDLVPDVWLCAMCTGSPTATGYES